MGFLHTLYTWWIIANEKFLEKQSSSESVLHRLATDQSPKLLWPIRDAQCNGKFRSPRKVAATTSTYLHAFHARKRKCECKESVRSSHEICGGRCALVLQLTWRNAAILSSILGQSWKKKDKVLKTDYAISICANLIFNYRCSIIETLAIYFYIVWPQ